MMGLCFQSLAQLQTRYPDTEWQILLSACDTQLFFGANDEFTAKLVSNRTGEISVTTSSRSKVLDSWRISNYTPEFRETESTGKRKLLTPDEVLRLPAHQALVILHAQNVLKVNKFDYTRHPEAKKLRPVKASAHIPAWHKQREQEKSRPAGTIPRVSKNRSTNTGNGNGAGSAPPDAVPVDKKSILL